MVWNQNVFENQNQENKINIQDPELKNKKDKIDLDLEVKKIFAKI